MRLCHLSPLRVIFRVYLSGLKVQCLWLHLCPSSRWERLHSSQRYNFYNFIYGSMFLHTNSVHQTQLAYLLYTVWYGIVLWCRWKLFRKWIYGMPQLSCGSPVFLECPSCSCGFSECMGSNVGSIIMEHTPSLRMFQLLN